MPRADAQRNIEALLAAAEQEFAVHGIDVGIREIAARAGVGTATLYRHFPLRSDLITAVFRREVDACAEEAGRLAATMEPHRALDDWLRHYASFISTKRGISVALHSGDPAYAGVPAHFQGRLGPALQELLDAAAATGAVRASVDPIDLLDAVAKLSIRPVGERDAGRAGRMVELLLAGLRYQPSTASR